MLIDPLVYRAAEIASPRDEAQAPAARLAACQGPDNPPKHPPQTSGAFYAWFIAKNCAHQQHAG